MDVDTTRFYIFEKIDENREAAWVSMYGSLHALSSSMAGRLFISLCGVASLKIQSIGQTVPFCHECRRELNRGRFSLRRNRVVDTEEPDEETSMGA